MVLVVTQLFLAMAVTCGLVSTAPVPADMLATRQLAGEGAACNSILSSTDNGVGYGIENAENNLAGNIGKAKGGKAARQLAGEGAACDSILSSTDNGVGYGIENAEDNVAKTLGGKGSTTGSTSGSPAPAGGKPAPAPGGGPKGGPAHPKRQGDKIGKGLGNIIAAGGNQQVGQQVTDSTGSVDGELTSGAADLGAQLGKTEESMLETAGSSVARRGDVNGGSAHAKRQGDKIGKGLGNIIAAGGNQQVGQQVTDSTGSLDGELTSGAANLGAQLGQTEESMLETAGSSL